MQTDQKVFIAKLINITFGLLNPEVGHYYFLTYLKMIISSYRHSFEGYAGYYTGVI